MTCRDFENKIIFRFFEELSEEEQKNLDLHKDGCAACALLYHQVTTSLSLIETESSENEDLKDFVFPSREKRTISSSIKRLSIYAAAASAALLLFIGGFRGGNFIQSAQGEISKAYSEYDVIYDLQMESAEAFLIEESTLDNNE